MNKRKVRGEEEEIVKKNAKSSIDTPKLKKMVVDSSQVARSPHSAQPEDGAVKNETLAADDEFMFSFDDKEFTHVADVAREWSAKEKISLFGLNCDEGESIARRLRVFVEHEHPALAKTVEKDGTVYDAVIMFLSESAKDDESSDDVTE